MTRPLEITLDNLIEWFGIERYPGPSTPVELPFPNLELRTDGIWIQAPDDQAAENLTRSEFHALYRDHPTEDPTKAALQLPCTSADLVKFLEWQGDAEFYLSEDSDFSPLPSDIKKALNTERAASKLDSPPKDSRKKWEIPERWEYKARRIGSQYLEEERNKGRTGIGVAEIAKHVAAELRQQGHRSNRTNAFLDWETIKSEALTGITGRASNGKSPKK